MSWIRDMLLHKSYASVYTRGDPGERLLVAAGRSFDDKYL